MKRGANNYAVFSGDLIPIVEFTLENNGLTMHVRQTRADKWSSALEVHDKASDNTLDERHWIGVVSNRFESLPRTKRYFTTPVPERCDVFNDALECGSFPLLLLLYSFGFVSIRLRGMKEVLRLENSVLDLAAKAFTSTYNFAGELGDARWRLYPSLQQVLNSAGAVRIGVSTAIPIPSFSHP